MAGVEIQDQLIQLDRPGGKLPVYVASPTESAKYPAVIIIHEIFGLNDHIKNIAQRFAREGMAAFAPDLFARSLKSTDQRDDLDAMRAIWQAIPDGHLIADLQEVFELARFSQFVQPNSIGTIGYCMGGAIALMFACHTPQIAWIADYYGRIFYPQLSDTKPMHPIDYTSTLKCPFLGLFAGQDQLITKDHIEQLEKRVELSGQPQQIKIYETAKHAFFNDRREFFDAAAAADAWELTLDFIANATKQEAKR